MADQPQWLGGPAEHDTYFHVGGGKLVALHVKGDVAWVTHVRAVVVEKCSVAEVDRRTRAWIEALAKLHPTLGRFVQETQMLDMKEQVLKENEAQLQDASPTHELRPCACCAAGGDDTPKDCEFHEDTGLEPAWLCDDCYRDWKAQP